MPDLLERLTTALGDRYAIQSEIGRGGMAAVFLAGDLKHHRKVAVKVMHPDISSDVATERFLREIEIAAGLTHPLILPIHDSGQADGLLYCVMPFIEGESLRDRLLREKQLPVGDALRFTREVAEALGYAHEHGIIHRDIKPANILLQHDHALVADFGIARAVEQAGGARITHTGVAVGTPAYMSPEQGTGEADLDGRTDIYALGCVLFEMLAGDPPYTGVTPLAVIKRHALEPIPHVRTVRASIPDSVEHALTKALSKVPADRYRTAPEFAAALSPDLAHRPTSRRVILRRLTNAVLAIALLVGGAWLSGLLRTGGQATSDSLATPEYQGVQVTHDGHVRAAAISPDGGRLAYCTDSWDEARIVLAELAPLGDSRTVAEIYGCGDEIVWLPDGSGVVAEATVLGQLDHLARYVISLPGGAPRRVQCGDGVDYFAISPDGSKCASNARQDKHILVGPLDASMPIDTIQIEGEYDYLKVVDWLQGHRLAFETGSPPGSGTVWTIDLDGGDPESAITVDNPFSWRWSQDGSTLYYQVSGYDTFDLLRLAVTLGGRRSGEPEHLLTTSSESIAISPINGRGLVTVRGTDRSRLVRVSADSTASPPTSLLTSITDWIDDWITFSVSNDGKWVAYDAEQWIMKKPVEGGTPDRLSREGLSPAWSPDDRYVAYAAELRDTLRMWITRPDRSAWPTMIRGEALSGIFTSWGGRRLFAIHRSMSNIQVLEDLSAWNIEQQEWLPFENVMEQDTDPRRGVRASARYLLPNDSVGVQILRLLPRPPDGRGLLVYWARTLDGSRATDSTAYWGNWLVSLDGVTQTRLSGQGMPVGWTDDGEGYYVKSWEPVATLNLHSIVGGEPTPIMTLPGDLSFCELRHGTDPQELVCQESEADFDVWLVQPVDSQVG